MHCRSQRVCAKEKRCLSAALHTTMSVLQWRSLDFARDDDRAKRYLKKGGEAATFISNFAFKRSFQTQSKGNIPQGLTLNPKRGCEITIISFSRSICRGGLAALIGVTGKPYPSCLSCHSHPIRPCGAPSPRGEGCDTRILSSKKGGEAATRAMNPEPNERK